jgi:hypothetical protein
VTTVQTPTVGVLYTIDFDNIEAVGISAYRGQLVVAGNLNEYNPASTTNKLKRTVKVYMLEAESGLGIWEKDYEGWELLALEQGATGLEGLSMVFSWFSGNSVGGIIFNQPVLGDEIIVSITWKLGRTVSIFQPKWTKGNLASGDKIKIQQLYRPRTMSNIY